MINCVARWNEPLRRWEYDLGEAQWVIDDLYKDISEFMGETIEQTMRKCRMGANRVNLLWQAEDPQTEEERLRFYRKTDMHIYEGANWHSDYPAPLQRYSIAQKCHGRTAIYGCGIGTEGFFAMYNPAVREVSFFDLENSVLLNFVLFRRSKHMDTPAKFWYGSTESFGVVNEGYYDTIVCIDVLEHLNDPLGMLKIFRRTLGPGGKVLIDAPFDDVSPPGHLIQNKDLNLIDMLKGAGLDKWEINLLRPEKYQSRG